jgi:hypothetical protein
VTANAVFSSAPIAGGEQLSNLARSLAEAADYLTNPQAPIGRVDLSPKRGKLDIDAFKLPSKEPLPDLNRDFDGRTYEHPIAGAYARDHAIWPLRLVRKVPGQPRK